MRQEWLDDILAVLDAGSFVRAAERRNISQSAFTRRIRTIEAGLGAPLFDRARKPVTLLPALRAQEVEMRRLAADLRSLSETLREAADGSGRSVSLACQHAITTTVSPRLVRALSVAGWGSVRVRSGNRDECQVQLISGEADLVVRYDRPFRSADMAGDAFEAVTLGTERLLPVCAPAILPALDAGRLPAIVYPREVYLGRVVEQEVWPALPPGTILQRKAETALTLAACRYAQDGIGVAWLPQSMVAEDLVSGRLVSPHRAGPEVPLEIRLLRLATPQRAAARDAWEILTNLPPDAAP
ncbi:DNA-binding transcriptional regulator, LysR family [Cribrihabitans marinus]|uniref:DNA-binding transcriptional regulator, LysR family n=1 Tax=Cribrihabitans marinus TaxID=1227549 RepID=A0A1H6W6Q9_9RHOB|nr:LysR substrate-binding domain-containing protein [Cribrihabitans marinus]GGH24958.1 LysR family transcriptional regulator [Cribrihabitans marinus]SEJ09757.1 DNA-binding transcriptional regulator, LysR family [Cribrihabitans marinus]